MTRANRGLGYLGTFVLIAACEGSPFKPTDPIQIVSGAGVEDTISSVLSAPLVIALYDRKGAALVGTSVEFVSTAVEVDYGGFKSMLPQLLLSRIGNSQLSSSVIEVTDNTGRATVEVRFGDRTGVAGVVITTAGQSEADTARYTIRPGNPFLLDLEPSDSTLFIDSTYALRAVWKDRIGNIRSDPVSYTAASDVVAVDESGVVRGRRIGRATIVATAGSFRDSAHASVVPPGVIAASWSPLHGQPQRVMVFRTDGSRLWDIALPETLCNVSGLNWHPRGEHLVFVASTPAVACHYRHIYKWDAAQPTLPAQLLFRQATSEIFEMHPHYDPTGEWIYFTNRPDGQTGEIWRIRANGTEAERAGEEAAFNDVDDYPSVSSDGTTLRYVSNRVHRVTGRPAIRTLDLRTRALQTLQVIGTAARWSPDESLIAFVGDLDGDYIVARPDGTSVRKLTSPWLGSTDTPSWSPDGRWLVVVAPGGLVLLEIATGLELPLAWSSQLRSPSWRP